MACCPIGLSHDRIEEGLQSLGGRDMKCYVGALLGYALYNINTFTLVSPRSPRASSRPIITEASQLVHTTAIQCAARQERQRGSRGVPVISRDLRQEEVKRENAGSGSKSLLYSPPPWT
jgi:hypothetical protein